MANKVIYAVYEDPEQLKDGARKLVSNGVKVKDTFSPFPIHGIDPIMVTFAFIKRNTVNLYSCLPFMSGTTKAAQHKCICHTTLIIGADFNSWYLV